MIWDNFSIIRTSYAILTSYIRANPRTCRGFLLVCCHVAWSKMVRVASFHSEGRKEEPGLFYALLCSELMEKVSFSVSKISLISRFEWIISTRACCTRKLSRLLSKKTLHFEIPKQFLITTKILFCRVSYCFCFFGEFANVFESQVWCARLAHLHSAARALFKSESVFSIIRLIIKITISSLVIGLKMSYFPLVRLPSCYRIVCYWIVCYWTVCYRTVQ